MHLLTLTLKNSGRSNRRSSKTSRENFNWMRSNRSPLRKICEPVQSFTIPKHSFKTSARPSRASALAHTVHLHGSESKLTAIYLELSEYRGVRWRGL